MIVLSSSTWLTASMNLCLNEVHIPLITILITSTFSQLYYLLKNFNIIEMRRKWNMKIGNANFPSEPIYCKMHAWFLYGNTKNELLFQISYSQINRIFDLGFGIDEFLYLPVQLVGKLERFVFHFVQSIE